MRSLRIVHQRRLRVLQSARHGVGPIVEEAGEKPPGRAVVVRCGPMAGDDLSSPCGDECADEAVERLAAAGGDAGLPRRIYAGLSGGFVRLYKGGGTGIPNVSWEDIDVLGYDAAQMQADVHGKLSLPRGAKLIEGKAS